MTAVVTEVLRQAAIFPAAVVAREDWLLGQVAVHNYARLLYQLFAASNEPVGPMGVKQWSSRLRPTSARCWPRSRSRVPTVTTWWAP